MDSQTHDPIEGDTVPASGPDYEFHQIISKRNLEDFSRLWINLAGLQDILTATNSPLQIGLKWQSFTGTPAINIYPSADGTGSDSYLKDDDAAETQIADVFNNAVIDKSGKQTVDTTGTFIFKPDYWIGLTAANPKKCLLFEGAGAGTGQLTVVILDQNGNELGHGPGVWLNLEDSRATHSSYVARNHRSLIVDVFAVTDRDDQDKQHVVFDLAEDAIIAHPVTPQPGQIGLERLAKAARVFLGGDALVQVSDDIFLGLPIQFL